MKEKKFETASEFIELRVKKGNYNMTNLPFILLACDQQFINKDKLKDEIKKVFIKNSCNSFSAYLLENDILKLLE